MSTRAASGDVGGNNKRRQPKRLRTGDLRDVDVGGPIDDEATARRKLEEAGFDPDKLSMAKKNSLSLYPMTPMAYFCWHGDLAMCRHLFIHGVAANDTATNEYGETFWFPMYAAALKGHVEVCQWLCKRGAAEDVRRVNCANCTPLSAAIGRENCDSMCQWLIFNGALGSDATGHVNNFIVRRDLICYSSRKELLRLLTWARDVEQVNATFRNVFLMGTVAAPEFSVPSLCRLLSTKLGSESAAELLMEDTPNERYRRIWTELTVHKSPLHCFSGLQGIMELVADFVGVVRGRDLRTVRELEEHLDRHLKSDYYDDDSEDDDSENSDY